MNRLLTLVIAGCAAVLIFDALAATTSRRLGFPYVWASLGSFVVYLVLGAIAARRTGLAAAATLGLVVGLVDAALGETISTAIGPIRAPLESDAWWYRLLIGAEVTGIAIIVSCIGGIVATWWFRRG